MSEEKFAKRSPQKFFITPLHSTFSTRRRRPMTLHAGVRALKRAGKVTRLLALDGIQDPGNLGTLVRTALALGKDGISTCSRCYYHLVHSDCFVPSRGTDCVSGLMTLPSSAVFFVFPLHSRIDSSGDETKEQLHTWYECVPGDGLGCGGVAAGHL